MMILYLIYTYITLCQEIYLKSHSVSNASDILYVQVFEHLFGTFPKILYVERLRKLFQAHCSLPESKEYQVLYVKA